MRGHNCSRKEPLRMPSDRAFCGSSGLLWISLALAPSSAQNPKGAQGQHTPPECRAKTEHRSEASILDAVRNEFPERQYRIHGHCDHEKPQDKVELAKGSGLGHPHHSRCEHQHQMGEDTRQHFVERELQRAQITHLNMSRQFDVEIVRAHSPAQATDVHEQCAPGRKTLDIITLRCSGWKPVWLAHVVQYYKENEAELLVFPHYDLQRR
mmetsp:Transcript_35038/g.113442  ORF Transcript_35038/g.113442 Transcript_35038/m.113442 type:complete len:210 (+) Transcript_35038:27-656(+)